MQKAVSVRISDKSVIKLITTLSWLIWSSSLTARVLTHLLVSTAEIPMTQGTVSPVINAFINPQKRDPHLCMHKKIKAV